MKTKIIATCATALLCTCTIVQVNASHGATEYQDVPKVTAEDGLNEDIFYPEEERMTIRNARRERHQRHLDRWDTDENGRISEEERDAAKVAHRHLKEERQTGRFEVADINEDGFLSYNEFSAVPAVKRLNENHPDKPGWIFNNLDVSRDGVLDLEEFISHPPFHHHPMFRSGRAQE